MRLRAAHWLTALPLALLLVCLLTLAACGQGGSGTVATEGSTTSSAAGATTSETAGTPSSDTQSNTFTLDELAKFDGQKGSPPYVAVDGVVYDVSDSAYWNGGKHSSCNLGAMAGRDLSELIKQAPARMRSVLQGMPVVGSLAQ